MNIASVQTSGVNLAAVVVCKVCSEVLKLYHLDFCAIKCVNCPNVIGVDEIKEALIQKE